MKKDYLHIRRIHKLSKADIALNMPLYQKVMKVQEEAGEVAQAFLEYDNANNVSASAKTEDKELELLSECCDVINCAMDVVNHITHNRKDLQKKMVELSSAKLDKWENKQKIYLKKAKSKVKVTVVDSKMEYKPTKMFPNGEHVMTQYMSDGSVIESGGGSMGNDW